MLGEKCSGNDDEVLVENNEYKKIAWKIYWAESACDKNGLSKTDTHDTHCLIDRDMVKMVRLPRKCIW